MGRSISGYRQPLAVSFITTTQLMLAIQCHMRPSIPRPNSCPNLFPKKQPNQKSTGPIYLQGHDYKLLSQEAKEALQNTTLRQLKSSDLELYIEQILYQIFMKIHKK